MTHPAKFTGVEIDTPIGKVIAHESKGGVWMVLALLRQSLSTPLDIAQTLRQMADEIEGKEA